MKDKVYIFFQIAKYLKLEIKMYHQFTKIFRISESTVMTINLEIL